MLKIKKSTALIALVVLVSVFVYYRYATKILQVNKGKEAIPTTEVLPVASKKVSAVVSYMVTEDKKDTLRFALTLDKQGIITEVATLDAETNEVPEKKKPFNEQVSVMIVGKKLSELSAIDNVAKSTLTTNAFNSVVDQLKAQL
ncbi:MAG: FMN-binding protein [Candidatus Moraniibacteriota bacterium]